MTGYTRQSSIDNGTTGDAGEINAEYNQVQAAFSASTGHTHDGSIGEGARIEDISSPDASKQVVCTNSITTVTGPLAVTGLIDGRDVAADGTKLDGIATGATDDQTGAEIKTAYEAEANAFTDTQFTKLAGIETSATADQSAAELLTAIKTVDGAASGLDADLLDGVEGANYLRSDISATMSVAAGGQILNLKDTGATGNSANPHMTFQDSAGTVQSFVGQVSAADGIFRVSSLDGIQLTAAGGGDVVCQAGGTSKAIFSSALTVLDINIGGEILRIRDSGATTTAANPLIGFRDSADTLLGLVGFNSVSNTDLYLNSESGGMQFFTTNALVMSLDADGKASIYGDDTDDVKLRLGRAAQTADTLIDFWDDNSATYRSLGWDDSQDTFILENNAGSGSEITTADNFAVMDAAFGVAGGLIGEIVAYGGSGVPTGWLKCNGASFSDTTYPDLALIYTTPFNVPDLRGEFLRGWDDGRGVDSGRAINTTQVNDMESHRHSAGIWIENALGTLFNGVRASGGSSKNAGISGGAGADPWGLFVGGSETRPRNFSVSYIVRAL